MMDLAASGVTVYSTCRSSIGYNERSHLRRLVEIAGWADDAGYRGALIYSDNTSIDSLMAAQAAIAGTAGFVPLVAVQPVDRSPFTLARAVSSLAHLYGRRIDINFVSGGFSRDLAVQGDTASHDARYDRLTEYAKIVEELLTGGMVTFAGEYYNVRRARLTAPVPHDLLPKVYVSGSSPASLQAGEALGVGQLSFPLVPEDFVSPGIRKNKYGSGISVGIIAREDSAEAWRIAHKRFPATPEGAERMKMLLSAAVSSWQPQLAAVPIPDDAPGQAYWLVPFRYHHTFCPYLVGSYDEVARAVATYLDGGIRTFVLDIPEEPDDLWHARTAIERAVAAMDR
ncbi:LLM class flavin-dependent oxidoreductase [Saccharothrix yanglingensis]|uniref:Alkanesulfonate monooxygenase n=1 Tax=Saccharothrix yanglingensis TaxID=659496 RepID=A0ABU0X8I6_9PSEU|nr:LLM class flavin-dependent oxidoreductase [Saccharothrix yanglingensis]MDQ2588440.1 alkanesulfonate monooxygenase [Saccharothrix yanglingensis]